MEANKILTADILDIIFEGKNKDYGAYALRKSYNKTLGKALIITGAVLLLVFLASVIGNYISNNADKKHLMWWIPKWLKLKKTNHHHRHLHLLLLHRHHHRK